MELRDTKKKRKIDDKGNYFGSVIININIILT
jgi:hypothetical protein